MSIQGRCMCEAIKVTINNPPNEAVYCHCDNCRKQSGASGTYVIICDDYNVRIDGNVRTYVDRKTDSGTPLERYFCGDCGCPVYSTTSLLPGKSVIKMGLFEHVPKATAEWYCKNKQSWEPSIEGATLADTTPP